MFAKALFSPLTATALIIGISSLATAQMGGMGMPMPTPMPTTTATAPMPTPTPMPTTTATAPMMRSGSSSKAAAIGAAGGAVGAGLLYWGLHNRATLVGCVGGDGDTLVSENDGHTYTLISKDVVLRPGERVELKGKKREHGTAFEIHKMAQNFGPCRSTTAEKK
jgi:hypothetical protein